MARLNTHLSATPQYPSRRSSTVDSLYRDPSVPPNPNRGSTYLVLSPSSQNSDKENETPNSRETTPRPAKRRQPMGPPSAQARFPTPGSSTSSQHANKRRRTSQHGHSEIYEDDDAGAEEEEGEEDGDQQQEDEQEEDAAEKDDEFTRNYDPMQDPEARRKIRSKIRNHHREIEDTRDDLTRPGDKGLIAHIRRQDEYMTKVKQTSDAALDSRVMVTATDLASKKMQNTLHGNNSVGIDLDQFVSRCIQYMRSSNNAPTPHRRSTQSSHRRRTQTQTDDEDEEESGEALDWAHMGRSACFPFIARPPVSSFLLGPLSVQKKVRKTQTQRTARSQRAAQGPATRPQELTQRDIQQSENSSLTNMVENIHKLLQKHLNTQVQKFEEWMDTLDEEPSDEEVQDAMRQCRVYQCSDDTPGASLFDFVVNPFSFGQTVENLFYVTFLIKEAHVKVDFDADGLPLLVPVVETKLSDLRSKGSQKHQAIFGMDWPTWKTLIQAFDIKEPLIPHRESEQTTVTAGGWYG